MTLLYRSVRFAAWAAFKMVGRTRVIGYENLPSEGGVIVACNHVSYLDPPLVGSTIRRECAFMARHDLWNCKPLGWLITRLNAFPVHRDTPDISALRRAADEVKSGKVLVLFPEGTRSPDARLQKAHPGLALIVRQARAPVMPCAVVGPEVMWPPGARFLRPAQLTVVFGSPIYFTDDASRDEVLDTTMGFIAGLLTVHRPHLPPGDAYRPLYA